MGKVKISMSPNDKLPETIDNFLNWQQREDASISEGFAIIAQFVNVDTISLIVYSTTSNKILYSEQFPPDCIPSSELLAAVKDQCNTNIKKWVSEPVDKQTRHRVSYLVRTENSDIVCQVNLWNKTPIHFENTLQIFIDMACPLIAQKHKLITQRGKTPKYIVEAFSAIADGFILYDKDEKIIAFNKRQMELFLSVADVLAIGVKYEDLLKEQLKVKQIDIAEQDQETWINARRAQLKTHGFIEEQYFDNGKTIQLTNYQTESGGTIAVRSDITELVTARQKAQENENLFRTLLVDAPIPLVIISEETIVYGNSLAHDLFELEEGDLVGKKTDHFYWQLETKKYLREKVTVKEHEISIRTIKGNKKIVLATSTRIEYEDEPAIFVSLLDITESVKTKDALAHSEKQNREILELIPDALIVQVGGEIKFVNKGAVKIFGTVNKDNMIGTPSLALSSNDESKNILALRKAAVGNKTNQSILTKHKRYDGTIFPSEIHSQAFVWNGQVGTLNIIRDISKRREYEEKLIQNETEMAQAQKIGRFGHWRIRLSDKHLSWSEELYRMHGLDPETKNLDLDWAQTFIVEEDRKGLIRKIRQAIAEKIPKNYEAKLLTTNGSIRHMVGTVLPEFDVNGHVVSVFGVSQDVTEQRELEEKLRQSQKMEAVGQLTGGIAHDFNNLLAIIQGNTELLMEMLDAEEHDKKSRLDVIMHASKRGADLTSSMLAFGRTQRLKPSISKLDTQVQNMLKVLGRTIEEDIEIVFSSDPDLWSCVVDISQVENALLNLALNARDAMRNGGKLTIETKNISLEHTDEVEQVDCEPGDYVMLSVSDTGTGIATETLEHVFEPFYTTKDVGEGTGLGLSMVYGFIKQSNGHIAITSELGIGTTVKIYLPRADKKT